MTNLQNYCTELDYAQDQERKIRGSHYISRVENPIGVCDTLWIPVTTSNRGASVNLNHTLNGFDKEGVLWGENGNCCTPYQIIELPDSLFNPSERNGESVDHQKETTFLNELGKRLIKKLNKNYTDPMLAIKADNRMSVIIETIKEKEFIVGYENIDYLYSLIRHYVYECDLNLQIKQYYSELKYNLDEESLKEYQSLKEKYLDNEMLQWKNNNIFLEMTQKMQHAYCCTPEKFEVLDQHFRQFDESRSIIFCKYIASREACEKYFKKATVLSYQKESLGLNLQHLNHTVYFDKIWDLALRTQAGHRTFRTGNEYDCTYLDLTGNVGLEKLIDTNIIKKVEMTEYFKGKTKEEVRAEL